jgi:mono/diheme cytochrome c family protein
LFAKTRNFFAVALAGVLFGCQSGQFGPPALSDSLVAKGISYGVTREDLAVGRRIYATQCTACHSLEPVENYPSDKWREIVGTMAGRAKLDAAQRAQLLAYLLAARASL